MRRLLLLVLLAAVLNPGSCDHPDAGRRIRAARDPDEEGAWWVARLVPALVLRSDRPRRATDVTITAFATRSRLEPLELQCQSWGGVIALAVYVPLVNGRVHSPGDPEHDEGLSAVLAALAAWHGARRGERCAMDLAVFTEALGDLPERNDWWKMPVNSMRNLALAMAETDLVIMLDADFLVGPRSFEDSLRDPANYAAITSLLRARRAVMVLPALEYNQTLEGAAAGKARTLAAARAGGRRGAVDALRAGALVPFHGRYHERTDYARWAAARDPAENATAAEEAGDGGGGSGIAGGVDGDELGAAVPRSLLSFEAAPNATGVTGGAASPGDAAGYFYEVEYPPALRRRRVTVVNPTYEPYVMALREQLPDPLWDERFRGYHLNKIEGMVYLSHSGFRFLVHPGAYVLHWPHSRRAPKEKDREITKSAKSWQLDKIWDTELLTSLQATQPYAPVARSHAAARRVLADSLRGPECPPKPARGVPGCVAPLAARRADGAREAM